MSDATAIRCLNDRFRRSFCGGRVMLTPAVQALPQPQLASLLAKLRDFDDFPHNDDPHGEHDFGALQLEHDRYYFKIDYYAPDMRHGSEDAADPARTVRVLTLMRADEY